MTVIIPDTLTIPGIPFLINLEYAKINPTGAISNLPVGISYECNPLIVNFLKNPRMYYIKRDANQCQYAQGL